MATFREKYDSVINVVDGLVIRGGGAGVIAVAMMRAVGMVCPQMRLLSRICSGITCWFAADAVADAAAKQLQESAAQVGDLIEATIVTPKKYTEAIQDSEEVK